MKIAKLGAVVALAATLGACTNTGYQTSDYGTKETLGTLAGAALGGWAGSTIGNGSGRLAATAAGVVLGGLIGNQIGRGLDDADQRTAYRAEQAALERYPDGQYARWDNPNNGNSGYTVPQGTYQTASGQYCREFETTIVVGGRVETGRGVACRQPDGSWQVAG
ncbi:MAG: RT0821/Lpp0805 family surface protein [Alphaproteobacteria bacterium]